MACEVGGLGNIAIIASGVLGLATLLTFFGITIISPDATIDNGGTDVTGKVKKFETSGLSLLWVILAVGALLTAVQGFFGIGGRLCEDNMPAK